MKKVSEIRTQLIEEKKEVLTKLDESNKYLDFAKGYHKKNGVSGPFDAKFKGKKKEQEKYMGELGKAWAKYKKDNGIETKKGGFPDKKK